MLDGITHRAQATRGLLCRQSDARESNDAAHVSEFAELDAQAER